MAGGLAKRREVANRGRIAGVNFENVSRGHGLEHLAGPEHGQRTGKTSGIELLGHDTVQGLQLKA